ncbi:hypothetical protein [Chitinophaga varians]|uniref:hypothetical protein n=1 Tax=Chitinophaga varians TaxID=2202339 RepID=UPI00165FF92F|nr:hypothetical protein [Chitinophaga varians]MBC9911839.1 hypothetical protein [Chitinophaga varians]
MKKMFTLWFFLTMMMSGYAQTTINCEEQLQLVLNKVKEEKGMSGVYNHVNTLKRLSGLCPGEWLPDYYIAYFDLQLVLSKATDRPADLLQEAAEKLAVLKSNAKANASEVYTLEGYYYYAMIAQDPAVNGQKYFREVVAGYEKAIRLDPSNPRPQLQLAIFQNRMAAFMKQTDNGFCDKLQQLEQTFRDFKPASAVAPGWGLPELLYVRQNNCH